MKFIRLKAKLSRGPLEVGYKKILIHVNYNKSAIRTLRVSPKQLVADLRKKAAQHYGLAREDGLQNMIVIRVDNKILRNDELSLEASGISSNCEVACDFGLLGGAGNPEIRFDSIPVENFSSLIKHIRSDFDEWVKNEHPHYEKRFEGDKMVGIPVVWDGSSGPIQYFFKTKEINPSERFKQFYSKNKHSIAVSYVWSATTLEQMKGEGFLFLTIISSIDGLHLCCYQVNSTSQSTGWSISSLMFFVCLSQMWTRLPLC